MEHSNTGHFYYSEQQDARCREMAERGLCAYRQNYALIEGEVVRYSEWINSEHGANFDDAVYLGFGEYHHGDTIIQSPRLDIATMAKRGLEYCQEQLEWPEVIGGGK